ncbi:hypothetical protein H8E88_24420 [candidate division KSB1 bacterium]|nr:hypothetical protein [candidate division KSB1 bacterium]MBL7093090.1 hypothetical protein [candidate division KSB1 bacterium]
MVDINLIGDDQDQFEDDNEKDFNDNYDSDSNDFDQSSYMKGGTMDNQDYTKVIRKGGSKAGVYILFIIVIALLAVVAYILFKSEKTEEIAQQDFPYTETQLEDDTAGTNIDQPDEFDSSLPSETISPELKEKVIQCQVGINTIEQIVNTIPANVDFTMITYSDGKFLSELLATREGDIDNVNTQLKQRINSATIKILSRDKRNVKGKQYYQALINGSLNQDAMTGTARQPMFLSSEEFRQKLTTMCQESNLTVKQFNVAVEKSEGSLIIQPIKFRAFGLKANATSILKQILAENLNISFSKISLIANDIDLSNPYIALVMNIELYRE